MRQFSNSSRQDEGVPPDPQAVCLGPGLSLPRACATLRRRGPAARLTERGWEVVRRATGGAPSCIPMNLTYSVTGSAEEPALTGGVLESYNRIAQALLLAVKRPGIAG